MYIMSDFDKTFLLDLVLQFSSMSDPSDYLKTEIDLFKNILRDMEYISTRDYLKLNQQRKKENDEQPN